MPLPEPADLLLSEAANYTSRLCNVTVSDAREGLVREFSEGNFLRPWGYRPTEPTTPLFLDRSIWRQEGTDIVWERDSVSYLHVDGSGAKFRREIVDIHIGRHKIEQWAATATPAWTAPHWTYATVLAWICLRDRRILERAASPIYTDFALDLEIAHRLANPAVGLAPQRPSSRAAKVEIINKLQTPGLDCIGRLHGRGAMKKVESRESWIGAEICWRIGNSNAAPFARLRGGEELTDLHFAREQVLVTWPEIAATRGSTEMVKAREAAPTPDEGASAYTPEYLEIARRAIQTFNITADNQPKAEVLRDWFSQQTIDGKRLSGRDASFLTTFVRQSGMKGGRAARRRTKNEG